MKRGDVPIGREDVDRAGTLNRLEFDRVVMEAQSHSGAANTLCSLTELITESFPCVQSRACRCRSTLKAASRRARPSRRSTAAKALRRAWSPDRDKRVRTDDPVQFESS